MKESYKEDLANHFGFELYADDGNVMGVATTEGYAGKRWNGSAESKNLSMRRNFNRENREIAEISARVSNHAIVERSENAFGGTADMYVSGKSDDFVVPTKLANKTGTPAAESMEGRGSPKSGCVRFAIAPDTAPDHAVSKSTCTACSEGFIVTVIA